LQFLSRLPLHIFHLSQTGGVYIIEVDESTVGNILNKAPSLTVCRVCELMAAGSLNTVSSLMLSDTGLYLNYDPTSLAEEDEEPFLPSPWSETDYQGQRKSILRAYFVVFNNVLIC
jgi:hypothetical protein